MPRSANEFVAKHRLPLSYKAIIKQFWEPLAKSIAERSERPLIVGINGAQGSGKSTLADCLKFILETEHSFKAEILSLDDFYYSKEKRSELAKSVHPLLQTRGAPGTHDVDAILETFALIKAQSTNEISWPRFSKANDDRNDSPNTASLPIDVVLFEGWCVGAKAQEPEELEEPINELERSVDDNGNWRRYVNESLSMSYQLAFQQIDLLVMLQVPSWQSVIEWRLLQEQKLRDSTNGGMTDNKVREFTQYFERLTRHQLATLPEVADVLIKLDESHEIKCIEE